MMNLMALDNFDIVCCLHTFNQIEREKQKIKHEKKKKMKKGVLNIHIGHMVLMECEVESWMYGLIGFMEMKDGLNLVFILSNLNYVLIFDCGA